MTSGYHGGNTETKVYVEKLSDLAILQDTPAFKMLAFPHAFEGYDGSNPPVNNIYIYISPMNPYAFITMVSND